MDIFGLGTGSLRRDEFYTFLGGLFVALSWFVGLNLSKPSASAGITIADTAFLVFLWLLSTLIVYVLLFALYLVVPAYAKKQVTKMGVEKIIQILGLAGPPLYFMQKAAMDEDKIIAHVLGLMVVCVPLCVYPWSQSAFLSAQHVVWIVVFAAWVFLAYRFYRMWVTIHAMTNLVMRQLMYPIDFDTYAKEMARFLAGQAKIGLDDFYKKTREHQQQQQQQQRTS
jgi:hypothetical protein